MGICTRCGAVYNEADEHECLVENIPPKGKEFVKGVLVNNVKAIK